uniref:Uncharacterized protein n=1 Tax=Hordeum vulgare subsp. vulgare TaxID=112509 RepID=A0A8I6Y241_HORVV
MPGRPSRQVVRLTRYIDVPGHTAMLVRVMSVCGYRWYPEYTVEEQYRDFNQSQYICTVRVFPDYPGAEKPIHWSYGLGVTVDMAVQDAAYSMLTIMRARHALLQNLEFCYVPAFQSGEEGYLSGVYFDSSMEDPLLQSTVEMLENRDKDARALRMELYATRARLWTALTQLAPVVQTGYGEMEMLNPVRTHLPAHVDWPAIGGVTPLRGPLLPPVRGPRPHPYPYGSQGSQARVFPDPQVELPGHGGNLYEMFYADA